MFLAFRFLALLDTHTPRQVKAAAHHNYHGGINNSIYYCYCDHYCNYHHHGLHRLRRLHRQQRQQQPPGASHARIPQLPLPRFCFRQPQSIGAPHATESSRFRFALMIQFCADGYRHRSASSKLKILNMKFNVTMNKKAFE